MARKQSAGKNEGTVDYSQLFSKLSLPEAKAVLCVLSRQAKHRIMVPCQYLKKVPHAKPTFHAHLSNPPTQAHY